VDLRASKKAPSSARRFESVVSIYIVIFERRGEKKVSVPLTRVVGIGPPGHQGSRSRAAVERAELGETPNLDIHDGGFFAAPEAPALCVQPVAPRQSFELMCRASVSRPAPWPSSFSSTPVEC
jgi:hypothetical protein